MSTDWIEGGPMWVGPAQDSLAEDFPTKTADEIVRGYPGPGLGPQLRPYEETQSLDDVLAAEVARRRGKSMIGDCWVTEEMRRRIAQQRDPAHDQGPFPMADDPVLKVADLRVDGKSYVTGKHADLIVVDDLEARSDEQHRAAVAEWFTYEPQVALPPISWRKPEPGEVAIVGGHVVCTFDNPILYEAFHASRRVHESAMAALVSDIQAGKYDPPVKRELMWMFHNLIAHPISEITHWLGFICPWFRELGLKLHDATVPRHAPNTGRG